MIKNIENFFLISIIGPTAIGKTDLAIFLAKKLSTEILSCDSRQFYKELNIGVAKPSTQQLSQITHHFIGHITIEDKYSVGKFEEEALLKLNTLFQKRNIAIMVGGSMLYEKAVIEGLDYFPETTENTRFTLNKLYKEKGISHLQELLKRNDIDYYHQVDLSNAQRIIRALEVCIDTNKPFSSYRTSTVKPRNFKVIRIGLEADRAILYQRINKRVDTMMDEGLLMEVEAMKEYEQLNALQTVGYKELFQYLNQQQTLQESIEDIKTNTRRYAKRQLTWYRRQETINWYNYNTPHEEILKFIRLQLKQL